MGRKKSSYRPFDSDRIAALKEYNRGKWYQDEPYPRSADSPPSVEVIEEPTGLVNDDSRYTSDSTRDNPFYPYST